MDKQTQQLPVRNDGEVTLRLTAKHQNVSEAEKLIQHVEDLILERVGEFFYGYDQEFLHYKAIELLKRKGLTLACAESLTGGLLEIKSLKTLVFLLCLKAVSFVIIMM